MIATALTELFKLAYPIVLAPMGGVSGGDLAAAVSNAGGLGLVGGGYGDAAWLRTELSRATLESRIQSRVSGIDGVGNLGMIWQCLFLQSNKTPVIQRRV